MRNGASGTLRPDYCPLCTNPRDADAQFLVQIHAVPLMPEKNHEAIVLLGFYVRRESLSA